MKSLCYTYSYKRSNEGCLQSWKSVKIKDLQKIMNWMSVRQAENYHSWMDVTRILAKKQPVYLFEKLSVALQERQHGHDTRHGAQQVEPRLALIRSSWLYRVVADMQRMPRDLPGMLAGGAAETWPTGPGSGPGSLVTHSEMAICSLLTLFP